MLVGDVQGKTCILIDDIADTSYTITRAARLLTERGAKKIYAIITHGILSGGAIERISESDIDELVVSNTVPQDQVLEMLSKVKVCALFLPSATSINLSQLTYTLLLGL